MELRKHQNNNIKSGVPSSLEWPFPLKGTMSSLLNDKPSRQKQQIWTTNAQYIMNGTWAKRSRLLTSGSLNQILASNMASNAALRQSLVHLTMVLSTVMSLMTAKISQSRSTLTLST